MELLERIAGGAGSWLVPSNVAEWRHLPCSRPDAAPGRRFTVAEFIDGSNCTSARRSSPPTGSTKDDRMTHGGRDVIPHGRSPAEVAGMRRPEVADGDADVEHAQSTVKYLPADARPSRRLPTSGGSAALISLALCAALLALLGGLLLCRAGVQRSRKGGGGRIRRCRQKRDLFIVYADEDEAWVTGTHPTELHLYQGPSLDCADRDLPRTHLHDVS